MRSIVSFSNKRSPKEASEEVVNGIQNKLDFEPDLVFVYATQKYHGEYQMILDRIGDEFGDIPQIGASVDGMVYEENIRADGLSLVLCNDSEAEIRVKGERVKGALKTADKLSNKINCKEGVILLHFPLVHVPGLRDGLEFYARGAYYSQRVKGKDVEKQKEYAEKFSRYCDKNNIFYPPPTIIKKFAEKTNYEVPIVGVNVLHTQMKVNSPSIFCNFKDIQGGIAALSIEKKDINIIYDDIFSDKGKNIEETKNIVSNEFKVLKEFQAVFEKNVLISLDGKPPVEAVEDFVYISKNCEGEIIERFEKGSFEVWGPYFLIFFDETSNRMFHVGIRGYYPFDIFPFFVDISGFSDKVLLARVRAFTRLNDFISPLYMSGEQSRFKLFTIDVGAISAFGDKTYTLKNEISNLAKKNYFGIITEPASTYLPPKYQRRNYMLEVGENIFFSSAGTGSCIEI
ncbi:MAG: FIST N-terminal domain-containing protein [Halobacteriota archaeon]|nr:FIST N-terminal domain-containing protein [Halobacteriota archaeon]